MVRMMRFNEKRCTIWKSRGQQGVRPPSGQSLVGGSALRHGATTAGSSGLGLVATDPGIGPLWLCPRVLQAGAGPASGLDPGTRRSQPGQVSAGRRKEPREEAEG